MRAVFRVEHEIARLSSSTDVTAAALLFPHHQADDRDSDRDHDAAPLPAAAAFLTSPALLVRFSSSVSDRDSAAMAHRRSLVVAVLEGLLDGLSSGGGIDSSNSTDEAAAGDDSSSGGGGGFGGRKRRKVFGPLGLGGEDGSSSPSQWLDGDVRQFYVRPSRAARVPPSAAEALAASFGLALAGAPSTSDDGPPELWCLHGLDDVAPLLQRQFQQLQQPPGEQRWGRSGRVGD